LRVVESLLKVELGISLSKSFYHVPSVRGAITLLIYVVLDSIQLVAGPVVSGGQCLGR
jgi:hypothetical protein